MPTKARGGRSAGRPASGQGLGNALMNAKKREQNARSGSGKHVTDALNGQSCLQQSSLEDFLATAEMAKQSFEALHPSAVVVSEKELVAKARDATVPRPELSHVTVPIPKRPEWDETTTPEELHQAENAAFLAWRRELAELEESTDAVTTPFERNLDFWRQLWRVVERSDVVVQILDARDPLFYRSRDLEAYIRSFPGKQAVLVLNKADFLTAEEREMWTSYFKEQGVEMHLFSALAELLRLDLVGHGDGAGNLAGGDGELALPAHGKLEAQVDVLDKDKLLDMLEQRARKAGVEGRPTIGMVGYPNVGKSSLINAVVGGKKVSVSRQPGKTKHFQTLEVPDRDLRFCDCPGLVFPSVVATKAHLVIRGVQPIDVCQDLIAACELIASKIGTEPMLAHYSCAECAAQFRHETPGRLVLSAFAVKRQHFLGHKLPDLQWAARRMLVDYNEGSLLYVELPPGRERPAPAPQADGLAEAAHVAELGLEDEASFFQHQQMFEERSLEDIVKKMSKRQLRQMQKGIARGKIQARNDGSLDPFANQAQRLGSAAMGTAALRTFQSGRR